MSRRPLWRISVTATTDAAEDAVAELLACLFAASPSVYTDARTGRTRVSVYLPRKPAGLRTRLGELRKGLLDLRTAGLGSGRGRIVSGPLRRENWAESWRRHFPPLELGRALLVRPSWSRRRPRTGQAVIELDPGLSFGTGQHPTTEFCLRELVARRQPGTKQSFLDIGTGSGILAIAAVKLGYHPVAAFDVDPVAVKVARRNSRSNRVARKLRVYRADVTGLSLRPARRYSLVCANLLADLLLCERRRLIARLRSGGVIVIAGILKSEFETVRQAYERAGLRLIASASRREWRSGSFLRR